MCDAEMFVFNGFMILSASLVKEKRGLSALGPSVTAYWVRLTFWCINLFSSVFSRPWVLKPPPQFPPSTPWFVVLCYRLIICMARASPSTSSPLTLVYISLITLTVTCFSFLPCRWLHCELLSWYSTILGALFPYFSVGMLEYLFKAECSSDFFLIFGKQFPILTFW